jgi:hypothetical protein
MDLMKTFLKKLIRASLSPSGLTVAALLVAGSVQTSQAGSADPSANGSFTWDLSSHGAGQRGIALITFSNDLSGGAVPRGTFRGYQMLAAVPPKTNAPSSGRGGSTTGRGSSGSGSQTENFVFGFGPIDGTWQFNSKGQIVGFFSEPINVTSTVTNYHAGTVAEAITNDSTAEISAVFITFQEGQASITTNIMWLNPAGYSQQYTFNNPNVTLDVGSAELTNTVSFTGIAIAGRSISLICNSTFGKVVFKGIPAPKVPSVDLSGNWVGSKRENGLQMNEFFSLTSFALDNPFPLEFPDIADFPGIYFTTNGVGPGFGFSGVAMFSQRKTIGFTFFTDNGTLTSTIGNLKATKIGVTANTDGIENPLNRVNFKATLQ